MFDYITKLAAPAGKFTAESIIHRQQATQQITQQTTQQTIQQTTQQGSSEALPSSELTGSVIIGVIGQGCCCVAAEGKLSAGVLVSADPARKLFTFNRQIALAVAGSHAGRLALVRYMKEHLKTHQDKLKRQICTVEFAMEISKAVRYVGYNVQCIVGGFDRQVPVAIGIGPGGALFPAAFISLGSGASHAQEHLQRNFSTNMSENALQTLARNAINQACYGDSGAGRIYQSAIITPTALRLPPIERFINPTPLDQNCFKIPQDEIQYLYRKTTPWNIKTSNEQVPITIPQAPLQA